MSEFNDNDEDLLRALEEAGKEAEKKELEEKKVEEDIFMSTRFPFKYITDPDFLNKVSDDVLHPNFIDDFNYVRQAIGNLYNSKLSDELVNDFLQNIEKFPQKKINKLFLPEYMSFMSFYILLSQNFNMRILSLINKDLMEISDKIDEEMYKNYETKKNRAAFNLEDEDSLDNEELDDYEYNRKKYGNNIPDDYINWEKYGDILFKLNNALENKGLKFIKEISDYTKISIKDICSPRVILSAEIMGLEDQRTLKLISLEVCYRLKPFLNFAKI